MINWDELQLEHELEVVNEQYIKLDALWDFLTKEIFARLDDETVRDIDSDELYLFLKGKRDPIRVELAKLGDVRVGLRRIVRAGRRLKLKQQTTE